MPTTPSDSSSPRKAGSIMLVHYDRKGDAMRALALVAAFVGLFSADCCAQTSEAEMRAFPMPPQPGWSAVSAWTQEPYYGYWIRPSVSRPTGSIPANDFSYGLYAGPGLSGTTAVFWGAWGTTVIPPP